MRSPISSAALACVGVDFDGVLADGEMEPLPGSIDALYRLAARYDVIVYTQRPRAASSWLRKHGVRNLVLRVTDVKPECWVYIDDRGVRFTDWPSALAAVKLHRPEAEAARGHMMDDVAVR